MASIEQATHLYTPAQAEQVAAARTQAESDDPAGWVYTAKHDPMGTGLSFVEVHDETGAYVGKL